eukprot:1158305-Ditylum_brightwellii.AAC.1
MVLPNTCSRDSLFRCLHPDNACSPSNSPLRQTWSQTLSGRTRAWNCGGGNGGQGVGGRARSGGGARSCGQAGGGGGTRG